MKTKTLIILFFVILIAILVNSASPPNSSSSSYNIITGKEAKEMMDKDRDIIVLDVRTVEEFNAGHIEGALLIPDNEIDEKAEGALADKTATILVYCRSGRRSALAAKALSELGYSSVYDFGGIQDWEYEIVSF